MLNEKFEWDKDSLSSADPILGPSVWIKRECGKMAISKVKHSKPAGPSLIVCSDVDDFS